MPPDQVQNKKTDLDLLYTVTEKGKKNFTMNTENIYRVLRDHGDFKNTLREDTFKNKIEISENGKWRELDHDNDPINIQRKISTMFTFFQRVTKQMCYDAILITARENKFDSAIAWVKSLEWDGISRIEAWLTNVYGVEDNEYHKAIGSNWLKGLVKRIMFAGCKFDYVLVLEGEQGSKKSTSLAVLGRDWHLETTMGTESKDFFMQFQGKAIIEFSEGETLSRTEVKRMKGIITTQIDTFRVPYERKARDFPRRCVFAMTTNQDEYLKDETGNRRWLPVKLQCEEADVEWLEEFRDQLYAEAYHRVVVLKESVWEFPKEETKKQQAERRVHDPNTDLVVSWYRQLDGDKKTDGITVHDVYKDVYGMGFTSRPMTKYEEMAIAGILKDSLKLIKKRIMINGDRATRWFDDTNKSPYLIDPVEITKDSTDDEWGF